MNCKENRMIIQIKYFRCYEDTTIEFEDGKMTLLHGKSGIGKSTVLEAVYWCLFGQGTNYKNHHFAEQRVTVAITTTIEGFRAEIVRSKPQQTFTVRYKDMVLNGENASAFVFSNFGDSNMFLTSSYIKQGERCPLITASNAEKTKILHEITFGSSGLDDNPDKYVQKFSREIERAKGQEISERTKYEFLMQKYNELGSIVSQIPIRAKKTDVAKVQKKIKELEAKYTKAEMTLRELKTSESELNSLQIPSEQDIELVKRKQDIKLLLDKVYNKEIFPRLDENIRNREKFTELDVPYIQHDFAKIRLEIKQIENAKSYQANLDYYNREKQKHFELHKGKEEQYEKDMEEYKKKRANLDADYKIKCENEEKKYKEQMAAYSANAEELNKWSAACNALKKEAQDDYSSDLDLWNKHCSQLREQYSKEEDKYRTELKKHEESLQSKKILVELWQKWEAYSSLLKQMQDQGVEVQRLSEYQRYLGLSKLICPHCNASLSLEGSKLVSFEIERDQAFLSNAIKLINQYNKVKDTVFEPDCKIEDFVLYPKPTLPAKYVEPAKPAMRKVDLPKSPEKIKQPIFTKPIQPASPPMPQIPKPIPFAMAVPEAPAVSYDESRLIKLKNMLSLEHIKIITNLDQLIEMRPMYRELEQIVCPNVSLETLLSIREKSMILAKRIEQIRERLTQTEDIQLLSAELAKQGKKLKDAEREIEEDRILAQYEAIQAETRTQYDIYCEICSRYEKLCHILKIIQSVTSHAMEETAMAINAITNDILKYIFDEPIEVCLRTQKELKTRDETKLQINLTISYKGVLYASLRELSGGEQDRVSLALTLAMARVSNSSFLFLDECMSSLNAELRSRCIGAIRHQFADKTVINICHEVVEGLHDEVYKLE